MLINIDATHVSFIGYSQNYYVNCSSLDLKKEVTSTSEHKAFTIDLVVALQKQSQEANQVHLEGGISSTCAVVHDALVLQISNASKKRKKPVIEMIPFSHTDLGKILDQKGFDKVYHTHVMLGRVSKKNVNGVSANLL